MRVTIDDFETELNFIKSETVREFTKYCLEKAPIYFWSVPSSSGGKHHSSWSNIEGGLVNHVRATAFVCKQLAPAYSLSEEEVDAAVASCILHDICKYGLPGGRHTTPTHDATGARFVYALGTKYQQETGKTIALLKDICSGIMHHFGTWTKRTEGEKSPIKPFPEGYTKIEQLVHISDMVASRKGVNFEFLGTNSLVG